MKPSNYFLILFMTLFAFSCNEPTDMLTVINSNGSCYREFKATADSAFMTGDTTDKDNPFPVIIDSTCRISWKYGNNKPSTEFPLSKSLYDSIIANTPLPKEADVDKEKIPSGPFNVILRKDFKSVDEMAAKFRFKPSHEWNSIKVSYSLHKKFRWFYTFYTYQEKYPKIKTDFNIPIEKYMSKDEARFWFTGEPDLLQGMNGIEIRKYMGDMEDEYNKWFAENSWNAQYKVLIENYDSISKPPVTKKQLILLKDTIFKSEVKDFKDYDMKAILDKYFKTTVFSEFWNDEKGPMKEYEHKSAEQPFFEYSAKSFNYKLILPGKIIRPNNAVVKEDTLIWKLTADRMLYGDYVLEAQSRKANVWAFILTGLVLIIAIGSFIYKPKKK